jgi:hypothetical protein
MVITRGFAMATVLTAVAFLVVAFSFMAGALHFAQYKKKMQSCCGDALEPHERGKVEDEACFTCPRRLENENCDGDSEACDEITEEAGASAAGRL